MKEYKRYMWSQNKDNEKRDYNIIDGKWGVKESKGESKTFGFSKDGNIKLIQKYKNPEQLGTPFGIYLKDYFDTHGLNKNKDLFKTGLKAQKIKGKTIITVDGVDLKNRDIANRAGAFLITNKDTGGNVKKLYDDFLEDTKKLGAKIYLDPEDLKKEVERHNKNNTKKLIRNSSLGLVIGGGAGYLASKLILRKLTSRIKELGQKLKTGRLSTEEETELKNSISKARKTKIFSTLAGAAVGGLGSGLVTKKNQAKLTWE